MSREDFIAVGTRLFAVYLAFNVLWNAAGAAMFVFQDGMSSWAIFLVLFWLVALAVCGLLWVFPLTVARKLLPVMREPRSETALDARVALSLGLTLIGVWVLANAIVDGLYWLALVVRTNQLDYLTLDWNPDQVAGMVSTALELVIGAWLMLGNAGIGRLIHRFRYGPATHADAPAARPGDDT